MITIETAPILPTCHARHDEDAGAAAKRVFGPAAILGWWGSLPPGRTEEEVERIGYVSVRRSDRPWLVVRLRTAMRAQGGAA
jgi:hypothetical protein